MLLFWKYKENYVTRNVPEKFRDFLETGPTSQFLDSAIQRILYYPLVKKYKKSLELSSG